MSRRPKSETARSEATPVAPPGPLAPQGPWWRRITRADWLCAALLLAVTLGFFWQGLADPASIIREDAAYMFQPFFEYADADIAAGRFPHWDPYVSDGAPHHAAFQAAVLYPLRWPIFRLGYPVGFVTSLVLHYFLTALFVYIFCRTTLRCREAGALVGALSFGFGGYTLAAVTVPNFFQGSPWFVLTVLLVSQAMRRRRWSWAVAAAVPVGLMGLSGSVHLLLILSFGLGVWALGETVAACWRKVARNQGEWLAALWPLVVVGVALAVGGMIGMGQLVPGALQSKLSSRSGADWRFITEFSSDPSRAGLRLVVPFFYGDYRLGYWGENNYHGQCFYAGIVPLAAAIVALVLCRRNPWVLRWAVLIVAAGAVAAGRYLPVYRFLYDWVPQFDRLRNPARIFMWVQLGIACLAAIGIDEALRLGKQKLSAGPRAAAVAAGALVVVVLAGALWYLGDLAKDPTPGLDMIQRLNAEDHRLAGAGQEQAVGTMPARVMRDHDPIIWSAVAVAGVSAVAVAGFFLAGRLRRTWAVAVLAALLTADLGLFSAGMLYHSHIRKILTSPPPHVAWLQQHLGTYRYADWTGLEDVGTDFFRGMQFRIRSVSSGDVGGILRTPRQGRMCGVLAMPSYLLPPDQRALHLRLLNLVGVKYFVSTMPVEANLQAAGGGTFATEYSGDGLYVTRNNQAFGRCFLTGAVANVEGMDPDRIFGAVISGRADLRNLALIEQPDAPREERLGPNSDGNAELVGPDVPGQYCVRTDAPGLRQLVLTETYHPEWKCSVDGRETPIVLTDYAFMSVRVPAGQHEVRWWYDPASFRKGMTGTCLGIAIVVAFPIIARIRRRRQTVPDR